MTRDQLIEAIQKSVEGNRLACERAHQLAKTLNVPLKEIGALCNELNIKISGCMLGCF